LKETLEKEISNYEEYTITYIDRYYYCDEHEETGPVSLAKSVFEANKFIGYMIDDIFFVMPEILTEAYKVAKGATSFQVLTGVRRKLK